MNSRFLRRLPILLPFIATSALLAAWITHYGPNWPIRDSYGYFLYLDKIADGKLGIFEFLNMRANEHLVAFHVSVAMAFLKIFSGNPLPIVFANGALLIAFGVLIYAVSSTSVKNWKIQTSLAALICISILNPSQTSYLLWEFQIWLYIDMAFLATNTLLVEKYGIRAYPIVVLLCFLASFCAAPGTFLWLAAGMHMLYICSAQKNDKGTKYGAIILSLHFLAFLFFTWLLMQGRYGSPPRHTNDSLLSGITEHVHYGVTLIGGGFGIRNPSIAFTLGSSALIAWLVGTLMAARNKFAAAIDRTAFIIGNISLLWAAAFAVGRESFGIAWAFGAFHASPMLIPFYVSLGLYAISVYQRGVPTRKFVSTTLALICLTPSFTAIPFGRERSVEMRFNSTIAAAAECRNLDLPLDLKLRLNGLDGPLRIEYSDLNRHRVEICSHQPDLEQATLFLKLPDFFAHLSGNSRQSEDALRALWYVYLTRGDLQAAFPPSDPNHAQNLLRWAVGDAQTGSTYDPQALAKYADVYKSFADNLETTF